jgi:hypothetical protein
MMGVLTTISEPKGNTGMALFGSNNDDSTVNLPDIGFDFFYNGVNCRTLIYTSGNSWVGFGSATEHLKINRRDARYNNLFYSKEIENGKSVFRLRWEGNSSYSGSGNNLVWELILYNDNTMVLIIEAIPNNGTNSFDTKGGSGSASWQVGKSYVFYPTQEQGKAYTIQEGSYQQIIIKYLIDDGENGIKTWQDSAWVKIADAPVIESIIKNNGINALPASRNGLLLTNPTLLVWTDELTTPDLKIKTTAVPKPKLIKQNTDYLIPTGIKNVVITATVIGTAVIRIICSCDEGATWKAWNGSSWISVGTSDINNVKSNGMTPSILNAITETQWTTFLGGRQTIRFAYYLEQNLTNETCNIDHIRVNYK